MIQDDRKLKVGELVFDERLGGICYKWDMYLLWMAIFIPSALLVICW